MARRQQSGWTCEDCETAYRLKIFTCPRCKGTRFVEVDGMAKISTFGGVTDVRASGLLPGTAGELPEEVVGRADGTASLVNGEVEEVDSAPDATSEDDGPQDDDTSDAPGGEPATNLTGDDGPDEGADNSGERADSDNSGEEGDSGKRDTPAGSSGREDDADRKDDLPFDPGDYTVAEVKTKLAALNEEDAARVIESERAGKARTGITDLGS